MNAFCLGGILVLELLATTPFARAQELPFNELKFSNRAQCAVESETPTKSAFTLIDAYNSGRMAFAIGKSLNTNADEFSQSAMRDFRVAVAGLQNQVMEKLLKAELPLLPLNLTKEGADLGRYRKLASQCKSDLFCPDLRDYLSQLWKISTNANSKSVRTKLQLIDTFKDRNFLPLSLNAQTGCLYLKKFSPLQGPLQSTSINAQGLTQLAETLLHKEEFFTSCMDQDTRLDPRQSALQFNVRVSDSESWQKYGFDFWNSVKIYTSWAWRYAPELRDWSPKYAAIFRSINLEESILLVANGCESLLPPKCDHQTLTMNALRELAKKDNSPTEFDDLVPPGPDAKLLERGARSVNNDFLSTAAYDSASAWLAQFRKKFIETRWVMKNKLFNAHQNLTLLEQAHSPDELATDIQNFIAATPLVRDEAAYLCLEWRLSSDRKLDFLRSDIDRITELSDLAQLNSSVGLSITSQIHYFQQLSKSLEPVCSSLEDSKYFQQPGYTTNWIGLESWAKELTKKSLPEAPQTLPFLASVPVGGPYLRLGPKASDAVLCANPIDCARRVFKAGVDLYAASAYAESFLPLASTLPSAELFNPYAELKACKIYDPWYVQSKIQKIFVSDLVNTAIVGWNPIPLYIDADWTAPRVTSLKSLLEDGKIKFAPQVEKSKITGALLADFGPWLGAPCAVQISPNTDKAFNFYAFNGISLNYCDARVKHDGIADRPGDVQMATPNSPSVCTGCTLNFVGTASAASVGSSHLAFNPFKFGIYLFRALYRFTKGMRDKTNIPQSSLVRIDRVLETYERYHHRIPDYCVDALTEGYSCYSDLCASKLADDFERNYHIKALEITWVPDQLSSDAGTASNGKIASIRIPQCEGEINLRFSCNEDSGNNWWVQRRSLTGYGTCGKYLKEHL